MVKKKNKKIFLKEVLDLLDNRDFLSTTEIKKKGMKKNLYTNHSSYKFILGKLEELDLVKRMIEKKGTRVFTSWKRI